MLPTPSTAGESMPTSQGLSQMLQGIEKAGRSACLNHLESRSRRGMLRHCRVHDAQHHLKPPRCDENHCRPPDEVHRVDAIPVHGWTTPRQNRQQRDAAGDKCGYCEEKASEL